MNQRSTSDCTTHRLLGRAAVLAMDAIVIQDTEGIILTLNDSACRLYGYSEQEAVGMPFDNLLSSQHRQQWQQIRDSLHVNHMAGPILDSRIRRDGTHIQVRVTATLIPAQGDDPSVVCTIERSDAAQTGSQQALDAARAGLAQSQADLDDFAYVASHDLRAPLRGIRNLSQWITEDAAGVLPEQSARHLDQLIGRIDRMERLLDDLLQFSRAGRERHPVEIVDVNDMITEVLSLIDRPEGMTLEIPDNMPALRTGRVPLQQVWMNLISNAVKHHDHNDGRIMITWRPAQAASNRYVEFAVADDGPGVEPRYREKIFQMFQTLRPRDQVEGSGMGLAIVRRLVQGRGGKLWYEPAHPRGSVFRFTWPWDTAKTHQTEVIAHAVENRTSTVD